MTQATINSITDDQVVKATEAFSTALGSGMAVGKHILTVVEWSAQSDRGDTQKLASLLDRAERKGDAAARRTTATIFRALWPDMKTSKKAKRTDPTILTYGEQGQTPNPDALQNLRDNAGKISFRGTLAKVVKGDSTTPVFDPVKSAGNIVKRARKEGMNRADLLAYINAAFDAAETVTA